MYLRGSHQVLPPYPTTYSSLLSACGVLLYTWVDHTNLSITRASLPTVPYQAFFIYNPAQHLPGPSPLAVCSDTCVNSATFSPHETPFSNRMLDTRSFAILQAQQYPVSAIVYNNPALGTFYAAFQSPINRSTTVWTHSQLLPPLSPWVINVKKNDFPRQMINKTDAVDGNNSHRLTREASLYR